MSEKENHEPTKIQKSAVEVVKYLDKEFPKSNLERIHVLIDLLEIEFRALSFINVPAASLDQVGKNLIEDLQESLTHLWEEDKKYRKVKEGKDAKDLGS